jgi:hypothetical protein
MAFRHLIGGGGGFRRSIVFFKYLNSNFWMHARERNLR